MAVPQNRPPPLATTPALMVKAFHEKYRQDAGTSIHNKEKFAFRMRLITEEYKELIEAANDLEHDYTVERVAHFIKELQDLKYVLIGTEIAFGIPSDGAFARVHLSNMSKSLPTQVDLSGCSKIVKGPDYKPASLIDIATKVYNERSAQRD